MRNDVILDLAKCTEFRGALRTRAPRIVHGTALLLVLLLAAALTWAALTEADLVVRAAGRIRPMSNHGDSSGDFSEEISCEVGGRVVELCVDEGKSVSQGDVLLRLDATRVENEIAKLKRTIRTSEEELEKLKHIEQLLARQFESAEQKAEAELAEAEEQLNSARQRQATEIRLAELELAKAQDHETRTRNLAAQHVATQARLIEAVTLAHQAQEKLRQARLPADQGRLNVLQSAVELVQREYEVRHEEVRIKRQTKHGEVEAARLQLANLQLDRDQAVVRAPNDAVVTAVTTKVGDIVEPGKLGISMARQSGFQFEVAVSNSEIAHLRAGLPSRIKLDAYDYQSYGTLDGTLTTVAPDSHVAEGPDGTRVALYRLEIALTENHLERGAHHGRIKLGMTGQVEIVTGRESILTLLVRRIRQSISLG